MAFADRGIIIAYLGDPLTTAVWCAHLVAPCWEAGPASPLLPALLAHISTARGLGTYFVFGALGCHWRAQGVPVGPLTTAVWCVHNGPGVGGL